MQGRKRFTVAGTRGWQGVGAGMLAAALALLAPLAHAGPFGLEQGMRLEQLKQVAGLKDEGEFLYSTTRLPRTHPDFTDFRLLVTPEQGLCKLTAWTDPIPTNTYGEGGAASTPACWPRWRPGTVPTRSSTSSAPAASGTSRATG